MSTSLSDTIGPEILDLFKSLTSLRWSDRVQNGRTHQEATDDTIIYLSLTGQANDFHQGIQILREEGLLGTDRNIYYAGPRTIGIGPAPSGQGITTYLTRQEILQLPDTRMLDATLDARDLARYVQLSTVTSAAGSHERLSRMVDPETLNHAHFRVPVVLPPPPTEDIQYGNPTDAATFASLPRQTVSETILQGEQSTCAICMDELKVDALVIVLPRAHWFCAACATSWLGDNDTCPVCRAVVGPCGGRRI
ncbi:hypothetical protein N7490_008099 [Penicillium lividum]|nr:hypothetical protein N7490_008099 [Penicillium lividum]